MEEEVDSDGQKYRTAVSYDEHMSSHFHSWKEDFTEKPERFTETIKRCKKYGLLERCKYVPSRLATEEEMMVYHTKELIDILEKSQFLPLEEMRKLSRLYDYLYFHKDIYNNARLALGCTIDLVEQVVTGKVLNGFAIVRPPGHHAMSNEFNGYCYLNNVATAAKLAIKNHGLKRILILDWDVHHGQGIQYCFYDNPNVLYISIHKYLDGKEWPYLRESDYDHTGEGAGVGFNVNIPLNVIGCGNCDYMAVFHQIILPIAYEFDPELVIVSAGFDAALGCPEGEMEVTPVCFAHFVNLISSLAGGKLCLVLEGGYCIDTLAEGVALSLKTLLGDPCPMLEPLGTPDPRTRETILNVIKTLRPHWKCLQFQGHLSDSVVSEFKGVLDWPPQRDVKFYTNERPRTFSLSQECYNPEYLDAEEELKLRVAELMKKPLQPCAPNKVCLGYSEQSLLHKDISSGGFEECPERLQHLCKTLKNKGIWDRCLITPGRKATDDELSLAHSPDFIRQLKKIETMEEDALIKYQSSFKSVYFCQDSFTAACWSVGTLLSVVDDILTGQSQSGVALIRPPGHHAEANTTMGFCMFNNIGIAAKYAQQKHNVNRIVIIDWDIHHGNALQTLFYDDTSVLYISLHRFDKGSFYPYGGEGYHKCVGGNSAQGYNVNIAWNDEPKGDADYVAAFQNVILPLCYEFSPDLVLVAAGFDGAKGDNLGNYRLSPELFGHMTSMLKGLAHGKIILALEGGYNLDMTSESMAYCISTLLGDPLPSLSSMIPSQSAVTSICDTIDIQSEFWKSLQYRVDLPTEKQLEIIKEQKENSMREFEEQENEDKEEDKD
ncbi:protein deacetylase HDAC6-like isoform X2 [Mytilus galloprovincialis]|uniref:protein deacetylase HDAC6-like isoform X2 n=1 Tax=Mytilus galloprovincialis TaxID=29158 RepID=UPI003F7C31CA